MAAGERAVLLDTLAASRADAEAQSGLLGVDENSKGRTNPYNGYNPLPGSSTVGGFSADGKVFAVADQQGMIGFDLVTSKIAWPRKDFGSLELSDKTKFGVPSMMSCADGLFIIGSQAGRVIAVDIGAKGEIKWEVPLYYGASGAPRPGVPAGMGGRQPSPVCRPPQVGGGVVLLCHGNDYKVSLCDLGGGKLIWESKDAPSAAPMQPARGMGNQPGGIQAYLTPDGMLVMLKDGELTVRDAKAIKAQALKNADPAKAGAADIPLWKKPYDTAQGNAPRVLAVVSGLIVVQPKAAAGDLEVLSVLSGQTIASIRPDGGNLVSQVFSGVRNDLILICSVGGAAANTPNSRMNVYGMAVPQSATCGLNVQRWNLAENGKMVWSRTLVDNANTICNVPAPAIGQNCLFVAARTQPQPRGMPQQPDPSVAGYLLDMDKGAIQDQIELNAKKNFNRMGIIGGAEMTNGRLCVETGEGISVYAGQ
jgi:outer membrane protein assembly factor BamB